MKRLKSRHFCLDLRQLNLTQKKTPKQICKIKQIEEKMIVSVVSKRLRFTLRGGNILKINDQIDLPSWQVAALVRCQLYNSPGADIGHVVDNVGQVDGQPLDVGIAQVGPQLRHKHLPPCLRTNQTNIYNN